MNRLYQWLQHRLTFSRNVSHAGRGPRIVRTQVTVEEQQRMVLLSMPAAGAGDVCVCPLCGNPVGELPPERVGVVTLDHSQIHAQRPETQLGLEPVKQVNTPQPDKAR